MEQYISKSAVVAEINGRIEVYEKSGINFHLRISELKNILSFLDTLETKEMDLEKEIGLFTTKELLRKRNHSTGVYHLTQNDIGSIAKHFFELGLKAKNNQDEWNKTNTKPPFTTIMDGNKYSNPMLCYDKFGNYCIAQYVRWHTGHCGWYNNEEEEVSITHWKELKVQKGE